MVRRILVNCGSVRLLFNPSRVSYVCNGPANAKIHVFQASEVVLQTPIHNNYMMLLLLMMKNLDSVTLARESNY